MVLSGMVMFNMAVYGSVVMFLISFGIVGNGFIILIIMDSDDLSCFIVVILFDLGICFNMICVFIDFGVISVICNDVGIFGNFGDDFVLLEFFFIGVVLSFIGYNFFLFDVIVMFGFGNFGVIMAF